MKKTISTLCFGGLLSLGFAQEDFTKYVNPMIGTGGHGHVFPGATLPFGMVQLSPDNQKSEESQWDWCSGYHVSDSVIVGFSHTHMSGTGVSDLGDILVMPFIGENPFKTVWPDFKSKFSHKNEKSEVGYYKIFLDSSKVTAELTASQRVGFHQYTFPQNEASKIVIDLNHKIYWGYNTEVQLNVENDSTISGYKVISGGWASLRKVFFVMKFSKPFKKYVMSSKSWDNKQVNNRVNESLMRGNNARMYVEFATAANEKIKIKTSISMVDLPNARKNQEEISHWDFEKIVQNAKTQWNKHLSKIKIEGTDKQKEIFYTALYHTMIAPNQVADPDGRYTGPDYNIHTSKTGKFYSTFSLWDTYRGLNPLYTILLPSQVGDIANSMIEHYEQNGYLPIWTHWGAENHCMIANHAIPVLTDACLKGIGGFDCIKAYEAMKVSTTQDHPTSPWNFTKYAERGYYAWNLEGESVSKTLESAFNDWCVAQMAKKYGTEAEYNEYMRRAGFYKNLFNSKLGLMCPKDDKGVWKAGFDPKFVPEANRDITEGNSWQYTWSVQHDVPGLVTLMGGKDKFIIKLDSTFNEKNIPVSHSPDVSGLIGQYAHGNEPSHHIAYLYNYVNQPWKTQKLIRQILTTQYRNDFDGLSGNEDCGQMSAWYILSSMGFYPVNPASGVYDIGSPLHPKAEINLENGKKFTIIATNISDSNIYIQSMKLNGKPYDKYTISHTDILNGGVLEFVMGSKVKK